MKKVKAYIDPITFAKRGKATKFFRFNNYNLVEELFCELFNSISASYDAFKTNAKEIAQNTEKLF